ncbi:MAG: hypothetical protein H8E17_20960 [Deltaproteobacteria bacterium]|nr:hypothetical protein [Deltaproteobacteria bacterium]
MKKTIIDRYETTEKNQAIIDVFIHSVERLYHDFDKTAPYHRKELDQEFVEYLTECVQEIGKYPFIIQISLEKMPDKILMDRVNKSINSYYIYLKEVEIRSMKHMFRRFSILFVVGLVLLVLAILATRRLSSHEGVIAEVFAQGLTIAAWVSLWEALVNISLEWRPHRERIRLYNRIIDSRVVFRDRSNPVS